MKQPSVDRDVLGAKAVDRALAILFALADAQRALTLGELSRLCGLPKPTVHRLLRVLAAWDLVAVNVPHGQYQVGFAAFKLTAAIVKDRDVRAIARPFMQQLRDLSGETVALSLLINGQRVYIDQIESPYAMRWVVQIGDAAPLYRGAASKAILAFLPAEEQAEILKNTEFIVYTPKTPRSVADLEPQLAEIRRTGVALAFGEREPGIAAIAAPFLDSSGRPVGALTICGPEQRFNLAAMERCKEPLLQAVRAISAQLGYRVIAEAGAHRS